MLWICFALSGAAALALELLWMRSAGLVIGQTATTTAMVLASYFAGLGIGAAAGRRIQDDAVKTYGWLELGAAAGALWSLALFHLLGGDRAQALLATTGAIGQCMAIALAILPATICLGATLPAIGQALVSAHSIGRRSGLLYAMNTLGGAAGTVVAGFGLPLWIGVAASYAAAATCSAAAGLTALVLSRTGFTRQSENPPAAARRPPFSKGVAPRLMQHLSLPPLEKGAASAASGGFCPDVAESAALPDAAPARLRIVAAGAGALGLGLEVLWTRLFAQVLHNSVYSFTAIALVFLVAIAAGAALSAMLLHRTSPATLAAGALLAAAAATVGGTWAFVYCTDGLAYIGMHTGLAEYVVRIVLLAVVTAGPVALASGVVLPALWAAWGGRDGAARPLGDLSAANVAGGIAGAIGVAFFLVPALGLRGALLLAAVAYLVLADVVAPPSTRLRPLGYAALLGIVIASPTRAPILHLRSSGETLRDTLEGANGIVTVVDDDGDLQLRLDNYYVLGGTAAATNERRLGLLPLLLHPAPHRAAFVGLATGISASAGPALGVEQTTVIELVPEVATAARAHFGAWNGRLLERSDVRLVNGDGRRYLASTRERFDVIVADLFIPWHAGAGSLYSREMYDTVSRRLAPGGLFCQWLPLYQLTREEFDIITRSFLAVFPHTTLWRADFYPDRPVVGLVATTDNSALDVARIADRMARLPAWSRDPLLAAPRGLGMLYGGDLSAAADVFGDGPLNTDNRPIIEFMAPRLTRINAAGDKDWFTGEPLATFFEMLARRDAAAPLLADARELPAARQAGTALYRYALAAARHDDATAARYQDEVRDLVPDVIAAADAGEAPAALADASASLSALRREQEQMRQRLDAMAHRLGALTPGDAVP